MDGSDWSVSSAPIVVLHYFWDATKKAGYGAFIMAGNMMFMEIVSTLRRSQRVAASSKIHLKAYPTLEMGDLVWAYLGPREKTPPAPKFEFTQVTESHRYITKTWEECNWLQALEGAIDSQHASFLHRALTSDKTRSRFGQSASGYRARSLTPSHEVETTNYGLLFASVRPLGEEGNYVRTYHFVIPFYSLRAAQMGIAGEVKRPLVAGHMWVPMDDENCMVYDWIYSFGQTPIDVRWRDEFEWGSGRGPEDRTADFRKTRSKTNNWMIDRQAQKTLGYSGIEGINTQDHAIQESMGPIVDRSQEHLGASDKAIIAMRRMLLQAARSIGQGVDPPPARVLSTTSSGPSIKCCLLAQSGSRN